MNPLVEEEKAISSAGLCGQSDECILCKLKAQSLLYCKVVSKIRENWGIITWWTGIFTWVGFWSGDGV